MSLCGCVHLSKQGVPGAGVLLHLSLPVASRHSLEALVFVSEPGN